MPCLRAAQYGRSIVCQAGGLRTGDVDLSCWFCERAFTRAEVEADGTLLPRRPREGGPYFRYACKHCGRPSRVERNGAGALMGGPPPIVPLADALFATFDRRLRRELNSKRAHARRRAGRREWFMGPYSEQLIEDGWRPPAPRSARARREAPPPEPPPEPPPSAQPPPEPPPPEPPPPYPPEPPEPAPPEPHEVLGVAADADAEAVLAAFRELAKRYHPDRFANLDDDFAQLAHEKFKQIMAARDALLGEGEA